MTSRFAFFAAALGAASIVSIAAISCISCVGSGGTDTYACPSQAVFTGVYPAPADGGPAPAPPAGASVSAYMERRCGTMDCHGSDTRWLRLYGRLGLRHPAETNVTGGKPTTLAELLANYGSVCAIEPEKMAAAVQDQGQSAELLLVVQKARGIEAHKGGAVVKAGSPGDNCILGWLRGDDAATVAAACQQAIDGL